MASILLPSTITLLVILVCSYVFRTAPLCWNMCVSWLQAVWAGRNDATKKRFESCVAQVTADMRARRARIMVNICEPIIAVAAGVRLVLYICGPENEIHEEEFVITATFHRQIFLLLFFLLFPSLSHQGAFYCTIAMSWIVSALQFVYLFRTPDSHNLLLNHSLFVLVRCATAILLSNVRHTAVQQIILSVASCYCHLHKTTQGPSLSLSSSGAFWILHHESMVAPCIIAMTLIFERSLDAEARATLYQKEASDGKATAESLLSVMCDAVVHIGADMSIGKPAPKLAAMLMNPTAKLEGRSLCDLMTSDDSTRFQRVCATAQQDNHAKTLNVSLSDCYAMPVEMQLFIAGYRDFDDQLGYVVGLQENEQLNRQPSCVSVQHLEKSTPVREYRTCIASAMPTDDEARSVSGSLLEEACPSEVSTAITAAPTIVAPREQLSRQPSCVSVQHLEKTAPARKSRTCIASAMPTDDEARSVSGSLLEEACPSEVSTAITATPTFVAPRKSQERENDTQCATTKKSQTREVGTTIVKFADAVEKLASCDQERVPVVPAWSSLSEDTIKELELGRARFDYGADLDIASISDICSLTEETNKQLELGRAGFGCGTYLDSSSIINIADEINNSFDRISQSFSSLTEETIKQLDQGRARFHHLTDLADVISHNIEDHIDDRFGENHELGSKRRRRACLRATSQFSN